MTTLGWKLNGELESEIPVRKFYFGESLIGKPFETFLDELDELSWIDLEWIELNWRKIQKKPEKTLSLQRYCSRITIPQDSFLILSCGVYTDFIPFLFHFLSGFPAFRLQKQPFFLPEISFSVRAPLLAICGVWKQILYFQIQISHMAGNFTPKNSWFWNFSSTFFL